MNDFQVKLGYSHITLDPLVEPYYHEKYGCQFNFNDFNLIYRTCQECRKNQDQIEFISQTSDNCQGCKKIANSRICPVCQKMDDKDKFVKDNKLKIENELKNERQLILDTENYTLYQTYKQLYADSNISKVEEIKQLQLEFNSRLLSKNPKKLDQILQMNSERNLDYFNLIKTIKENLKHKEIINEIIPILMCVTDNKLILFYHKYKIKLELELFDETNHKIKPKIKTSTYGAVVQIVFHQNYVYLLFNKQEHYSVFHGNFLSIFAQNEAKFFVKKVVGAETVGCAKLFNLGGNQTPDGQKKVNERLVMVGNDGLFEIQPNQNSFKNLDIRLEKLNPTSQTTVSMKDTILIANDEQLKVMNKKQQQAVTKLCYVCKLTPLPPLMQTPAPLQIQLSPNQEFDNNIKFSEKLILYKTSKLTDPNMLVQIVSPGTNNVPQSSLKVINHASYLTPVKIPTTIAQFETISCKLIGLRLPPYTEAQQQNTDYSDIFPAVLVYNYQQSSVEIELI